MSGNYKLTVMMKIRRGSDECLLHGGGSKSQCKAWGNLQHGRLTQTNPSTNKVSMDLNFSG